MARFLSERASLALANPARSCYNEGMEQPYQPQQLSPQDIDSTVAQAYLNKVYLWMAGCMAVTAAVAAYTLNSVEALTWVVNHLLLTSLISLGVVVVMCFGARRLTRNALAAMLVIFAAVQGLLFGPICYAYTQESLGLTFGVTAGMFGGMSLFGYFTKRDLSAWGRGLFMALIGLIIAGIANCFWGNGTSDLVISGIGVIVFAGFTAYDTQMLLVQGLCTSGEEREKGAILGALNLYLDFINLFLYLLRFLGDRD